MKEKKNKIKTHIIVKSIHPLLCSESKVVILKKQGEH